MKEFINKNDTYLKIIGILIGIFALADTQMDLLLSVGFSPIHIKYMKLAGLILSLILPSIGSVINTGVKKLVGRPIRKPHKPPRIDKREFEFDVIEVFHIGDMLETYSDIMNGELLEVTDVVYLETGVVVTLNVEPQYNNYDSLYFY